jgi:purine-binding chemotaxis protein CheW
MKKGKRRSRNTSGRRKHADKKAEGTDRAENKTLPGLDHQDNTSMVKETESRLSSADSISEPPPSTEADKPDSDLESELGRNARDDSAADLVRGIDPEFDPKQEPQDAPTRPSDELLDEIDREITELIANIDAPSGAVFDQEREVEVSSKHNVTRVGSSSEVQLVKAFSEEEVAEGVDRDISPALNESVASELEVSAESEIATLPSVEEIIATMDEDALGVEAKGIESEEVLADQVEPAPLEADVAEALEVGAIETAEKVSEPETSLEEDADSAPLEADVAETLEVAAIETAEKVFEPETSLEEDADTAPLEELISELDGKIGQTLDSNRKEGEEIVKPGDQQSDDHGKYVRFLLDDIFMAIPLFSALEVGHRPDITPLPNLPDWVLGISNIRGEIVSVLDLKRFFGRSSPGASRGSHLIIIHNQDLKVGIIVDSIMGIISLDGQETDVQPNPYRSGEISSFLSGVVVSGEKLLNILDVDRLLAHPRMTDL